jgi:hypothetical protein
MGYTRIYSTLRVMVNGVVVRLGAGEDLENIVQDDLRLIESLGVILEGHITDPPIP